MIGGCNRSNEIRLIYLLKNKVIADVYFDCLKKIYFFLNILDNFQRVTSLSFQANQETLQKWFTLRKWRPQYLDVYHQKFMALFEEKHVAKETSRLRTILDFR